MTPIQIVIDNRLHVHLSDLEDEEMLEELKEQFAHDNPKHHELIRMGYSAHKEPAVVRTWRLSRHNQTIDFPRGGMQRLRDIFKKYGRTFRVIDGRTTGAPNMGAAMPDYVGHEPRDYQLEGVDAVISKQNCLIRASVGSGKTTVALMAAAKLKLATLVIVWNAALFNQWQRRVKEELGIEAGFYRGKKQKWAPVTIAMQQSLYRKIDENLREWPGFVVVDECHRAAARTVEEVTDAFPAKYRLGISDDERRKDGKEFLIYDQFAGVAQEVRFDDLVERGFVVDVEVCCIETGFRPPPGWWATTDFNVLLDAMVIDEQRNELIMKYAIAAAKRGERVLMMSHRVEHCRLLDRMISAQGIKTGLLLGGTEWAAEGERTRRGLESGELSIGIGTLQNVGTGIDIPSLCTEIVTTPIAGNESMFRQARGRVCRAAPGKKRAEMYYFLDVLYERSHVRNIAKLVRQVKVLHEGVWYSPDEWFDYLQDR